MRITNFANRWVYTGSLTTPPCSVGVYFQVVDRVLPISKKHYDLYLKQQREYVQKTIIEADGTDKHKVTDLGVEIPLDYTGNWRITQQIDNHNVTYMRQNHPVSQKGRFETVSAVVGVLFGLAILLSIILAICAVRIKKQISEKGSAMNEGGQADSALTNQNNFEVRPV